MCTKFYQNRLGFLEDMTKHFGVFFRFTVYIIVPLYTDVRLSHVSKDHLFIYLRVLTAWHVDGASSLWCDGFSSCSLWRYHWRVRWRHWWPPTAWLHHSWPGQSVLCFDTVGLVIWPVKIVPEMTYYVSSGTLSLYTTTTTTAYTTIVSVLASGKSRGGVWSGGR